MNYHSTSSKVRQEIAYKDTLSEDTAKSLLQDNDTSVLENILRSRSISSIITDEDIDRIISIGNLECIENILSNLSNYELVSQENTFHKLLELNNLDLTIAVADNYDTPKKILNQLTKHSDPDIAVKAKANLE